MDQGIKVLPIAIQITMVNQQLFMFQSILDGPIPIFWKMLLLCVTWEKTED